MVTLTREQSQTLRFPTLRISIEVERPDRGTTLVDVDAPKEFFEGNFDASKWAPGNESKEVDCNLRHTVCNRIHVATLALEILQRRTSDDEASEIEQTLEIAVESLNELESLACQQASSTVPDKHRFPMR